MSRPQDSACITCGGFLEEGAQGRSAEEWDTNTLEVTGDPLQQRRSSGELPSRQQPDALLISRPRQ